MNIIFELIVERKYIGIIAVLIGVAIVIIAVLVSTNKKRTRLRRKANYNKSKKSSILEECKSNEDLEFKLDTYQSNLKNELSKNKQIIQKAKNQGYIKANTTWTERFQELTDVSNTLYRNLEYENAQKLNKDKFHRYTSLHFRSVIVGNLAYEDYIDSKKVRDEISDLIVAIGKKQVQVTPAEKKELYEVKDTCVETTRYLYNRMVEIQTMTKQLKMKIHDECGVRGKEWYEKIERNKQKRRDLSI